jgi:hypothetical protein
MYQNILIPLDLSHKSQAVELANVAIALTAGQPATVHLLMLIKALFIARPILTLNRAI